MPQWFRFYSETTTDRKIDRICRATGQNKATIIGAWSIVMALASDSPIRGAVLLTEDHPFTIEDIAAELGLDDELTARVINQFIDFGMMHQEAGIFYLTNWDKRQFASDDSTERVRRYRERQQTEAEQQSNAECNGDETLQARSSNAPETDTETDTEPETEAESKSAKAPPPPAVQVYRSATNLFPRKSLWSGIAETIGEQEADLDRWKQVALGWVAMGWNPKNVKGMLQHYVEGRIPGDNHTRGSPKQKEPAGWQGIREWMQEEGIEWQAEAP